MCVSLLTLPSLFSLPLLSFFPHSSLCGVGEVTEKVSRSHTDKKVKGLSEVLGQKRGLS